ncbi:MAG: GNAT family N-acetyltransferase [Pseudohongiellaceae bacterium]
MTGKELQCSISGVQIVLPTGLANHLVFRVYRGPSQIAYAHLSRSSPGQRERFSREHVSGPPTVSYCLKNIEVAQNYRGCGIGSALLDEVLNYCRAHRVSRIHGEAKGDVAALKSWYQGKGFRVDARDEILLSL